MRRVLSMFMVNVNPLSLRSSTVQSVSEQINEDRGTGVPSYVHEYCLIDIDFLYCISLSTASQPVKCLPDVNT